jgi:hypothetical protein
MRTGWIGWTTCSLLLLVGCRPTIQHAVLDPEVIDFGLIDIDGDSTKAVTFTNLVDDDVYLYFLAPSTFEADMVPAGDDQGTPFDLEDELMLPAAEDLALDIQYGCWAQDRGYFRWEITVISSLEANGYWEATREVGELTLMGTCGDE